MNPYKEFEDYLNDGKEIKVEITPVSTMFNLYNILKKCNSGVISHPFVDMLYEKYDYLNVEPRYKIICTYIYYNHDTREFYIGSGNRNREYGHLTSLRHNNHYNKKFQKAYNKNKNFIFYYSETDTRKEALAFEQILIDYFYGMQYNLNGCRYVVVPMLNKIVSEETRFKQSLAKKGKPLSNIHIENNRLSKIGLKRSGMALVNIAKGQHISVSIDGKIYNNIKEAIIAKDISSATMYSRLDSDDIRWDKWFRVNSKKNFGRGWKQTIDTIKNRVLAISIPISINNIDYSSISGASKSLEIDEGTIRHRLKSKSNKFKNYVVKQVKS